MNIAQIKNVLDNYFATYSTIPTRISIYASSIYYEIYIKSIKNQDFSNRMKWTGVKIFEISPYENNLILIRFFVNTKKINKLLIGID